MAGEITSSAMATDQEKFLAAKLIARSYLKLVMGSLMDKVTQPEGAGLVANFVRYKRMNVPLATLSDDGQDPANSSFSIDSVTVTLDEWGDVVTLTNVAQLTTKHPLLQQAIALMADNAARVMDREITVVMLAGTNVQYGDASVTSRRTITNTMTISVNTMHKARITMVNNGAPPRGGPAGDAQQVAAKGQVFASAYVAVAGPEICADIQQPGTSLGTWAAVATYARADAMYNAEVGTFAGIRWVETNFIPSFTLYGNSTTAVTSTNGFGTGTPTVTTATTGGTLTDGVTYYWKITRKDLTRGFEEAISIAHSTAATSSANTNKMTFAFPSTAGYAYNLYFDTQQAGGDGTDAKLGLVQANIALSSSVVVTAPATGASPPDNLNVTAGVLPSTIYPIFIFAAEAMNWVGFYGVRTYITKDESIVGNVLRRRRSVGYTFFGKSVIRDQTRLLRLELASTFG